MGFLCKSSFHSFGINWIPRQNKCHYMCLPLSAFLSKLGIVWIKILWKSVEFSTKRSCKVYCWKEWVTIGKFFLLTYFMFQSIWISSWSLHFVCAEINKFVVMGSYYYQAITTTSVILIYYRFCKIALWKHISFHFSMSWGKTQQIRWSLYPWRLKLDRLE